MINRFTSFIRDRVIFSPEEKILLAVSGGIDSMVMWHLFEEAGFRYGIIHCNFRLRGRESDGDEALVREQARLQGVPLYVRKFDTLEHARLSGISIEMAARELRYSWFEEVRTKEKYDYLATAHHQDDLIETFFINLVRKTGIRGMTGFREKSGTVIRPLLFTNRQEIEAFAKITGVPFRRDSTNDDVVFQRNFIRHEIIPRLETLNPAFRANLAGTMGNLREVDDFYSTEVNRQIKKISDKESSNPEIYISALLRLPHPRQLLYEWMKRYGFKPATADALFTNLGTEPGRQYFSATHRLVTSRNTLIITSLPEIREELFYVEREDLEIFDPLHLSLESHDAGDFEIIRDARAACLDAGKLDFPLVIRKWKPGDYFQPLGMTGYKKVSDFFVDEKLSLPEKEESWILFSGSKVVWIIGQRIDNRFRVTPDTREVMLIRLGQ